MLELTDVTVRYGDSAAVDEVSLALDPGQVLVMDDIAMAYFAHFRPGEGHLVSAGTGSIGIHIAGDGEVIRVGGRGILIDDAGSGSWIALQGLDHIYRALDHTGSFAQVEALAREMFALVGGNSWSDVRQFVYAGDRGRTRRGRPGGEGTRRARHGRAAAGRSRARGGLPDLQRRRRRAAPAGPAPARG